MKRKVGIFGGISLLVAIAVFVVCLPAQSAEVKVIKLRFANFIPASHNINLQSEQWCREVEKRTNGRVKVTHFPGGTLVSAPQVWDSTVKGICDIGLSIQSYTPGRFPLSEVIDLPLGYTSALQATRTANAFYKKFRPKEYDEAKILLLHAHAPGAFHTRKFIASLDEIKGMRIKASGTTGKIVQAFGGTPLTLPAPETYDALQKGLADGVLISSDALKGLRLGDHLHYTLINPGVAYTAAFFIAMNKEKWASMPPDIQKVIEQVSEEFIDKFGKAWDDTAKEAEDFVRPQHKFTVATKADVGKAREKMKPLLVEYIQQMKAKNLPGEEAVKFCLDYIQTHP
jgi:TRAP-type C4-dicarboxylate transport system substrate-binding protein